MSGDGHWKDAETVGTVKDGINGDGNVKNGLEGRERKSTERNENKRKDKYFNVTVTVMHQKR